MFIQMMICYAGTSCWTASNLWVLITTSRLRLAFQSGTSDQIPCRLLNPTSTKIFLPQDLEVATISPLLPNYVISTISPHLSTPSVATQDPIVFNIGDNKHALRTNPLPSSYPALLPEITIEDTIHKRVQIRAEYQTSPAKLRISYPEDGEPPPTAILAPANDIQIPL